LNRKIKFVLPGGVVAILLLSLLTLASGRSSTFFDIPEALPLMNMEIF